MEYGEVSARVPLTTISPLFIDRPSEEGIVELVQHEGWWGGVVFLLV
jgi:hypothetical protein